MKISISEIMAMIDRLSPNLQIIFTIVILLIISFYLLDKNKLFSFIMRKLSKLIKNFSKRNLLAHSIFNNIYYLKNKVNNYDFGDSNKTVIFKIILSTLLQTTNLSLKKYFKNKITKSKYDFEKDMIMIMNDVIIDYEDEVKNKLIKKYEDKGIKLFKYCFLSKGGFKNYNKRNNQHIFDTIRIIMNSDVFNNNYERADICLSEVDNSLYYAVLDAEITFKNFNGEIKKIIDGK